MQSIALDTPDHHITFFFNFTKVQDKFSKAAMKIGLYWNQLTIGSRKWEEMFKETGLCDFRNLQVQIVYRENSIGHICTYIIYMSIYYMFIDHICRYIRRLGV